MYSVQSVVGVLLAKTGYIQAFMAVRKEGTEEAEYVRVEKSQTSGESEKGKGV